jgi:hypothetical protein
VFELDFHRSIAKYSIPNDQVPNMSFARFPDTVESSAESKHIRRARKFSEMMEFCVSRKSCALVVGKSRNAGLSVSQFVMENALGARSADFFEKRCYGVASFVFSSGLTHRFLPFSRLIS